ncbi:hypothetical protein [Stenotrophomonas acidaminiphila]|uniref:hypothetical protein n=1 Tax=Stenotrophomonas acidaminiphila TaxID=128780 RepID=UPI0024AE5C0C|nr:hypothetical protein [Stenotrophomonas acidaminiphila]WHL17665.1 hypothetical protein QLF99_11340 [Stenotrophomonas acidaminiphila]
MSAHKHTPGPWCVEGVGIRALVRAGINGVIVAVRHRLSAQEHEANARLIAAAPELLETLEPFAHATLTHTGQVIGLTREDFERALAAIAKATGEPA